MRRLDGLRISQRRLEMVETTVERRLVVGPDFTHESESFFQQTVPAFVGGTVIRHFFCVPSGANAKEDSSARQIVECGHLLCGDNRVSLYEKADPGRETQRRGRTCNC